jgi:hypothetical protein
VRLESAKISRSVTTDPNGDYAFGDIDGGDYEIFFALAGLEAAQ